MKKIVVQIRSLVLVFLTHQIELPLLKIVRKANTFDHSKDELKEFPPGSFGNDLYWFLEKRNLSLLKHYARHDLKHVLQNYDTTDEGEAGLQCYMPGNGRISFPVLATALYVIITMPEYWYKMRFAFQPGRRSISIHGRQWITEKTSDKQ